MEWLDLPVVQWALKSLLQHHSSKASVLWCSAFFIVQLSHPYTTTGKTIALTRWTFVGKVMCLLFNMLSRLVIAFLLRSKCLLKIKSVTVSIVAPSIYHEVKGLDAMILVFWMLSFKPNFSLSSFTFIKRLFSSSSLSAINGGVICISEVIDVFPSWLMFFPVDSQDCWFSESTILIPAFTSSSLAFHMMYSAYKLSKQGDNIQPWHSQRLWRSQ